MAIDRQKSPYRRGIRFAQLPIPMIEDHCIAVDAGAVQLVVESRRLTNEIIDATIGPIAAEDIVFDDGGASLHVVGTEDGLEHLRFDCFEHEPHYHYIDQADEANTVVRIDELAVGDPVEFTLTAVERHLPDMLRHSAPAGLADQVATQGHLVAEALVEVRTLMERAALPAS